MFARGNEDRHFAHAWGKAGFDTQIAAEAVEKSRRARIMQIEAAGPAQAGERCATARRQHIEFRAAIDVEVFAADQRQA